MKNCIQLLLLFTINIYPHLLAQHAELTPQFQKDLAAIHARATAFPPLENLWMVLPPEYLAEYERFGEQILEPWRDSPPMFVELALMFVRPLLNRPYDDRAFCMARKYVLAALPHIATLPFGLQIQLAGSLRCRPHAPPPDFASLRKEAAETRLRLWQRMLDALDPAYDPGYMPTIDPRFHVSPIPPEFRAAADAYEQKTRWHVSQYRLRQDLALYENIIPRTVAYFYSTPPHDFDELQKLLDTCIKDKVIRQKVLQETHNKVEAIRKAQAFVGEPED